MVDKSNRRLANRPAAKRKPSTVLRSGILTKSDIESRLRRPVSDTRSLVITPSPTEGSFDDDSVDLTLGSYFFVPHGHRTPYFLPGLTNQLCLYREQYVPLGSYLVLPAHHTILAATLEYIKLPPDLSGEILTKSSWARTFITIETAPWIHPRYRGCLTLEIANVSNTPVILYPGVKIAQLVLMKTTARKIKRGDNIEGKYVGPVRPEPSLLPTPREALDPLGVEAGSISYPFDEYLDSPEFLRHAARSLAAKGYAVRGPPSNETVKAT